MSARLVLLMAATSAFAAPEIVTVPEMGRIAALDASPSDHPHPLPAVPASFTAAFRPLQVRVQEQLTPAAVRALSRWAKPQMATYQRTPTMKGAAFKVARTTADGTLTLEATLDTLPTHSPLVTRWLKVIATFDPKTRTIGGVWITIRGEVLE